MLDPDPYPMNTDPKHCLRVQAFRDPVLNLHCRVVDPEWLPYLAVHSRSGSDAKPRPSKTLTNQKCGYVHEINVRSKKNKHKKIIFCWHLEDPWRKEQDLGPDSHPDPLVKGTDPRIRIRIKMLRIRNTGGGKSLQFQELRVPIRFTC
jgi:hypothetical protein